MSRGSMTHDELLAKIDSNLSNCGYDCESCKRDNASWVALRAVVELCNFLDKKGHCCVPVKEVIQAIEKELR